MYFDWRWNDAAQEFRRAIELNPNYATAHQWYATVFEVSGRTFEAEIERKKALEIDPFSIAANAYLGRVFYYAGRSDAAITQLKKTLEFDPSFLQAHRFLGHAYLQRGRLAEAIAELRATVGEKETNVQALGELGYGYAVAGRRNEALKVQLRLVELARHSYVSPYQFAIVSLGLGDRESAFEWLKKACDARDPWIIHVKFEPILRRSDPIGDLPTCCTVSAYEHSLPVPLFLPGAAGHLSYSVKKFLWTAF